MHSARRCRWVQPVVLNADKVAAEAATSVLTKCTITGTSVVSNKRPWKRLIARRPERVIEIAVKGVLPKARWVVLCSWLCGLRGHSHASTAFSLRV
ncbi:uL13 family ribosomal protein [Salmonella enterica subsp. enterica]|nr:uL13 family ribosomal protein [Salmonella enterica subsp. enterica]